MPCRVRLHLPDDDDGPRHHNDLRTDRHPAVPGRARQCRQVPHTRHQVPLVVHPTILLHRQLPTSATGDLRIYYIFRVDGLEWYKRNDMHTH